MVGRRGMTLIELMVVILLIAGATIAMAIGLASTSAGDVDTTASVLAGAMRYTSSLALQENATYRLVLDMDSRAFYAEKASTDDPCARYVSAEDKTIDLVEVEAGALEDESDRDKDRDEDAPKRAPTFSNAGEILLDANFEGQSNVSGVMTADHDRVQTTGKAAIYFYPTGYADRAMIWVGASESDGAGGTIYEPKVTLEIHQLGRITRRADVLSERDFIAELE
jgi:prepilin-type N-terminal cleavage/methylation domain-containing protein